MTRASRHAWHWRRFENAERLRSWQNGTEFKQANQTFAAHVLLTVLFASVLFFGGIAGTLDSRRLRINILAIGLAFVAVTLPFPETMPICQE